MQTTQSVAEPEASFSLPSAWEWAATLLGYVASLFGDPVSLKEEGFISRLVRRQIIEWLAPIEAFVRRLLFIEAAALPRSAGLQARISRSTSKLCAPEGARSGPRRASFRLFQPRRRKRGASNKGGGGGGVCSGRDADAIRSDPIARRFSALVRVINDPAPYARRLAKHLRAQTDDDIIEADLIEVRAPRFRINPVGPMFDEAHRPAAAAARSFRDTS